MEDAFTKAVFQSMEDHTEEFKEFEYVDVGLLAEEMGLITRLLMAYKINREPARIHQIRMKYKKELLRKMIAFKDCIDKLEHEINKVQL